VLAFGHRETQHLDNSGVGTHQAEEDAKQARFPGTVLAEQAERYPGLELEIDRAKRKQGYFFSTPARRDAAIVTAVTSRAMRLSFEYRIP
jgi:hypothetical protein